MEPQRQIKANVLIEIDNTFMHRLVGKQKSLFTSGNCKVAKIDNPTTQNTVYFINLNSFYYTLNKGVIFARLEYDDTVSYVFPHFDNGLSALTILKNVQKVHNFEQIISNAATLISFEQAVKNPDFASKVNQHCPNIDKQPVYGADKIKATIRQTGKIIGYGFKAIGQFLAGGLQTVGQYIGNKVQQPQQKTDVAPQTKQKWQSLKQGTSQAFNVSKQLYTKYLSPIVTVGVQYGKQVVHKIQTSENPTVKYARQLASTGGQAASTAFKGLAQGANQVGTELGAQSRKIVNKKYGEDYVHTFLPQGEEKKIQQKKQTQTQRTQLNETPTQSQDSAHHIKPLYPVLHQQKPQQPKEPKIQPKQ